MHTHPGHTGGLLIAYWNPYIYILVPTLSFTVCANVKQQLCVLSRSSCCCVFVDVVVEAGMQASDWRQGVWKWHNLTPFVPISHRRCIFLFSSLRQCKFVVVFKTQLCGVKVLIIYPSKKKGESESRGRTLSGSFFQLMPDRMAPQIYSQNRKKEEECLLLLLYKMRVDSGRRRTD